jgi:hypothetical protein
MKTNIAYMFAGLLTVTLLSCSDDSEPLVMQEEMSTPMLDYQTVADAQRALRPSMSSQQADEGEPDKKGQKGRDHRDWFEAFGNTRIKDFERDITQLDVGDLYAIDPDGVNPYIVKFYFPEEYRDYAKQWEGKIVSASMYYVENKGTFLMKQLFSTDSFSLDDSFLLSRRDWEGGYFDYVIRYSLACDNKEIKYKDLVIIKAWQ